MSSSVSKHYRTGALEWIPRAHFSCEGTGSEGAQVIAFPSHHLSAQADLLSTPEMNRTVYQLQLTCYSIVIF